MKSAEQKLGTFTFPRKWAIPLKNTLGTLLKFEYVLTMDLVACSVKPDLADLVNNIYSVLTYTMI